MHYIYKLRVIFMFLFLAGNTVLTGQTSKGAYAKADSIERFADLVYHSISEEHNIENTPLFWYKKNTPAGIEFWILDAKKATRKRAFDARKVESILIDETQQKYPLKSISMVKFNKQLSEITFFLNDSLWKIDITNYRIIEKVYQPPVKEPHWGITYPDVTDAKTLSPDSLWSACIKNFNVYITNRKTQEEIQLSHDGSGGEYYASAISWSPDGKFLVTNKIRPNTKQFIHFVESSPNDQIQPKWHTLEYLKPGDALPINQPSLFNITEKKQIPVDVSPYLNQFSLDGIAWNPDSRDFTFEFNQRGHQVYKIVKVEAQTGKITDLITETFPTFFDYSGKRYRYDTDGSKEIIWASERDGYNHLYLFDKITGKLKNQITRGNWMVREVVKVDTLKRQIIFGASGKNPDEDPYFVHYFRINFDGSKLMELTPEKLNHQVEFTSDYQFFTDTYSSANTAPVTVLRSATDGKVVMTVETADISQLMKAGYILPEPFVAKGRDGKTDIWGNIYRPTHFDKTKNYPIIEYIYAGPQSSYVQKTFRPYFYSFSGLVELGFIVVTIDGMGTSNRSKAFHDVCFQNLKDAGFPDRILWIKAAAEKYPYMDTTRVGIFGGSAGGQNSTAALLFHPEFYKVGVSSCGCHDNRMDKMWWNEQWLGYPVGKQYIENSNVENASRLQGHLMLIVGEVDDNVDPASTMQVADALIKAGKDFELVVLPGVNHTLGGKFGERKRRDFFLKYLYHEFTPDWNTK